MGFPQCWDFSVSPPHLLQTNIAWTVAPIIESKILPVNPANNTSNVWTLLWRKNCPERLIIPAPSREPIVPKRVTPPEPPGFNFRKQKQFLGVILE